jgi:hypothetical protein
MLALFLSITPSQDVVFSGFGACRRFPVPSLERLLASPRVLDPCGREAGDGRFVGKPPSARRFGSAQAPRSPAPQGVARCPCGGRSALGPPARRGSSSRQRAAGGVRTIRRQSSSAVASRVFGGSKMASRGVRGAAASSFRPLGQRAVEPMGFKREEADVPCRGEFWYGTHCQFFFVTVREIWSVTELAGVLFFVSPSTMMMTVMGASPRVSRFFFLLGRRAAVPASPGRLRSAARSARAHPL